MVCNYVLPLKLEELFLVNKLSRKFSFFPLPSWICLQNNPGCCGCSWYLFAIMTLKCILYILHNQFLWSFGAGLRLLLILQQHLQAQLHMRLYCARCCTLTPLTRVGIAIKRRNKLVRRKRIQREGINDRPTIKERVEWIHSVRLYWSEMQVSWNPFPQTTLFL